MNNAKFVVIFQSRVVTGYHKKKGIKEFNMKNLYRACKKPLDLKNLNLSPMITP